ncbi:MAG: hypothetical protein K9H25_18845 [Rhodospirillum sp.]|nr:hypothetical protein [Rhodospirillum sp.]MCF8491550.1 hypothetical protein [Rhodospirillum sp.]MCF8501568.1 hypothetical protein [Rhodospirillum sp.]
MSKLRKILSVTAAAVLLGTALPAALAEQASDPTPMDATKITARPANTMPAPKVTFSFDQTATLSCDDVLNNIAIGIPVPLSSAPCIESYLLATGLGREELTSDDPAAELFNDTLVGTLNDPDPMACEQVLIGLATGQAMPVTVAPCVTTYMLPHSPEMLAGENVNASGA